MVPVLVILMPQLSEWLELQACTTGLVYTGPFLRVLHRHVHIPLYPHTPRPHTQSHSHPEIVFISRSSGSKIVLGGAFVLAISYRERGVVFNPVLVGKALLGIQPWALQALYL